MGTCAQPGNACFSDFCLKQGIEFIIFCRYQGINFVLNRINVLNRVSKNRNFVLNRVGKSAIFEQGQGMRCRAAPRHPGIYRVLPRGLCPFQEHKYGRRKPTETSVFEFSYLCVNSSLEELRKIKATFILRQGIFR